MPTRLCRLIFATLVVLAVSAPLELLGIGGRRGYCSCSCSSTPNCTSDADCGGGRCLKGPTCC